MVVRSKAFYDEFFQRHHFEVVKAKRFKKEGACDEDQVGYVLEKAYV